MIDAIVMLYNLVLLNIAYAHLQDLLIQKGATISQGKIIGHVGSTGDAKYPQQHFTNRTCREYWRC